MHFYAAQTLCILNLIYDLYAGKMCKVQYFEDTASSLSHTEPASSLFLISQHFLLGWQSDVH